MKCAPAVYLFLRAPVLFIRFPRIFCCDVLYISSLSARGQSYAYRLMRNIHRPTSPFTHYEKPVYKMKNENEYRTYSSWRARVTPTRGSIPRDGVKQICVFACTAIITSIFQSWRTNSGLSVPLNIVKRRMNTERDAETVFARDVMRNGRTKIYRTAVVFRLDRAELRRASDNDVIKLWNVRHVRRIEPRRPRASRNFPDYRHLELSKSMCSKHNSKRHKNPPRNGVYSFKKSRFFHIVEKKKTVFCEKLVFF